jgi:hypothetical protein
VATEQVNATPLGHEKSRPRAAFSMQPKDYFEAAASGAEAAASGAEAGAAASEAGAAVTAGAEASTAAGAAEAAAAASSTFLPQAARAAAAIREANRSDLFIVILKRSIKGGKQLPVIVGTLQNWPVPNTLRHEKLEHFQCLAYDYNKTRELP